MPRLHLVTGHRLINRTDTPVLLYLGHDADQAGTAQNDAIAKGQVLIADRFIPTSPVTRYGDKKRLQDLPAETPPISLVVVELGEGDQKVIINVTTSEEARFIKHLADCAAGAEKLIAERNERIAKLEDDLKRETAYKAEVNQRIATLEADLKKAQEPAEPKAKPTK